MTNSTTGRRKPRGVTKQKIFDTSVDLFYINGYTNVSVRDIATAVKVKSSSLYCHYESKKALLESIYDFYHANYHSSLPDINEILHQIPNVPPYQVLENLRMPLTDTRPYDTLKKIILIAERECGNDSRARAIVSDMYKINTKRIITVLEKMISQGIIEQVDTETFASVFLRFGLSTTTNIENLQDLPLSQWHAGNKLLFELLRIKK